MSNAVTQYKEALKRQLDYVSPAELPGIMIAEDKYKRKSLFFQVELGDGIEAFRRIGIGQNDEERLETPDPTAGEADTIPTRQRPAKALPALQALELVRRAAQLRKLCQPRQWEEQDEQKSIITECGQEKGTILREKLDMYGFCPEEEALPLNRYKDEVEELDIDGFRPEKEALLLNGYKNEVSEIDNTKEIRIRPDISSELMAHYHTPNEKDGYRLFAKDTKVSFLFAPAGGGKSFFLQRLVLSCLETDREDRQFLQTYGIPDDEEGPLLPLRMACRGYNAGLTVEKNLLAEFTRLTGKKRLPEDLDRSRLLLVVDGMDEIDDRTRDGLYNKVIELRQNWGCRVLFSMRPTWVLKESQWEKIEGQYHSICIRPLNERQILGDPTSKCDGFALQWFHVIYPKANQARFAARIHQILYRSYDYIRNLMDTPLMTINILCLLTANSGISNDRGYVLQNLFELQLRWKVPYEKCDKTPRDRLLILAYVAYHISIHQTAELSLSEDKVIELWQDCNRQFTMLDQDAPLTPEQIKDTLEEFISSQPLLLWLTDQNGKFSLAFSHRQYLEFLTAFAIVNAYLPKGERGKSIAALLRPHFGDSMWQDVILYCLSLIHRNQDSYQEGLLHQALVKEWQPQYPLGGFGLLLSCHVPLTWEQREMWTRQFLSFDTDTAGSLIELIKSGENELLEELRSGMEQQGSSYRIPVSFLRMYEYRESLDQFFRKQLLNLGEGKNPENAAWNLYMMAWLRTRFSEKWLRENFPSMVKIDVVLPAETLESMVELTEQEMLPLHTVGLLRQAGMMGPEEQDVVFSQAYFDFCFTYLEKNWKNRKHIQSCFEIFAGFPIAVRTLAMTCPAAEELQEDLAAVSHKIAGDSYMICGLTAAMLAQPLNLQATLHSTPCRCLEHTVADKLQDQCCYPGQYTVVLQEISELRKYTEQWEMAAYRAPQEAMRGNSLKAAVCICRYIRENGGLAAARQSRENSARCSNLAYLARRDPKAELLIHRYGYTIETLLEDGIRRGEGCAVVNFCLLQLEQRRSMTDEIRAELSELKRHEWDHVLSWWKRLVSKNDLEGYLVLVWAAEYGDTSDQLPDLAAVKRFLKLSYGSRGIRLD